MEIVWILAYLVFNFTMVLFLVRYNLISKKDCLPVLLAWPYLVLMTVVTILAVLISMPFMVLYSLTAQRWLGGINDVLWRLGSRHSDQG
jgi:predicted neutral ceramidase superfamily lipid hydrolase